MTRQYELTPHARTDIVGILVTSYARFGAHVREGYEELIAAAIDTVVADPSHGGSQDRSELGAGIRAWHLHLSRDAVPRDVRRVVAPRHVVFYRELEGGVQILRVLHEAMDVTAQRFS